MTRASCPVPFNRHHRQPGSTPDPVTATAAWDPAVSQARVTFTASTAATVDHYELRHCPGAKTSTDDEFTIANTPATGNESGSNTVSATRPA